MIWFTVTVHSGLLAEIYIVRLATFCIVTKNMLVEAGSCSYNFLVDGPLSLFVISIAEGIVDALNIDHP